MIKEVKNTVPWAYLIEELNGEKKLLERFLKNNCKRQIKCSLELKKYSREKIINYMSNGEIMVIHLIVGLMKKIFYIKRHFQNHTVIIKPKQKLN